MSFALFRRELRANWRMAVIFAAVLTMYCAMVTSMFDPRLGESLAAMAKAMPQIFAAVGMLGAAGTLTQFLSNYLYGFLLILFPMVMILLLSTRLVARYVDNGSMAYLLATPAPRARIARTQAAVLLGFTAALGLYVTALCILCGQLMFPGALDIKAFVLLNLALLCLHIFYGGICFFFSCVLDDARHATGIPAALLVLFFLMKMLAQMGSQFDFLRYATPFSLFNPEAVLSGSGSALWGALVLVFVGLGLMGAGIEVFKRRDLPL